jgi:hypothetical protein
VEVRAVDDKLQAVVTAVLEAVDQRLAVVRDHVMQVAASISQQHADLQRQIDEVRRIAAASGADHAARQVFEAANELASHVEHFEERMRRYVDAQIASRGAGAPAAAAAVPPVTRPAAETVRATPAAPAVPAATNGHRPVTPAPAPSPAPAPTAVPATDDATGDPLIDAINARFAAAIEKALKL